MESGKVRWFNPQMGFGFIEPESGGPDVFVHVSSVRRAGFETLDAGQKIRFDLTASLHPGKISAYNLEAE